MAVPVAGWTVIVGAPITIIVRPIGATREYFFYLRLLCGQDHGNRLASSRGSHFATR